MPRATVHSGKVLAEELETLGVTPTELSRQIAVPPNRISQIINAKRAITACLLYVPHFPRGGGACAGPFIRQAGYDVAVANRRSPGGRKRGLPRRRRRLQPLRPRGTGERARSGTPQVRLVPDFQRPGRQRMAAAGDHHTVPGSDRHERDEVRVRTGSGERDAAGVGRPRRARAPHRARADPNWPGRYAAYMVAEQAGEELSS